MVRISRKNEKRITYLLLVLKKKYKIIGEVLINKGNAQKDVKRLSLNITVSAISVDIVHLVNLTIKLQAKTI